MRFNGKPLSQEAIRGLLKLCFMVEEIDGGSLCMENVADFVTDQIIDRLHIQFGCQPFLYAVDDL